MNYYRATRVRKESVDMQGFCGMHAKSLADYVAKAEVELQRNPNRKMYYDLWVASGRPVLVSVNIEYPFYNLYFWDAVTLNLTGAEK